MNVTTAEEVQPVVGEALHAHRHSVDTQRSHLADESRGDVVGIALHSEFLDFIDVDGEFLADGVDDVTQ